MANLIKLFKVDGENWEDQPTKKMMAKWSNIHTIIAQIVAVMPMTSDLLMQTVIDQFPYYKAGTYCNRAYIHNLIWISKYIPSLREQIMMAIINSMVTMDVNIMDQSRNKRQTELMFEMDVDEQDNVSETLDYCMLEVLKWLEDEREPVLNIMCNVFERVILPTHGTRYVQFLLVYVISISQQCADRVFNNLWMIAAGLHGSGPGALATRRTATSHLAGLLARCVRVTNSRLIQYLKNMAEWCHSYITAAQESTAVNDNTKVHGAFHAICHAIFYLVAFKNHHLFASKESLNFVESLNLPRLVTCSLNPLRTCPPQVTRAFSSVTRSHQVVYCQAIIEKNVRHTLQFCNAEEYDEWFPYDPYTLPRVQNVEWEGKLDSEKQNTYLDSDDDSEPEDVMYVLSQSTAQEKNVKVLQPEKPLVTPVDLLNIGEIPHVKYLVQKAEQIPKPKTSGHYKPFKTTKSDVHNPKKEIHRKKHKNWEVTAATPPPIVHGPAIALSLEESLKLQKEYNIHLKEVEVQHAAEKLLARTGIKMSDIPKDVSKFGQYRQADSDDSADTTDNEGSDKEIHDEEPERGGVIFTVMK
ncbi:unnamed protein product, partial [Iphiclides podalirius]